VKLVEGIADVDDLGSFLDRLDEIAAAHGCTVQAFDARYVVGRDHLRRAVELADRAIERGEAVARERGVEILLYAAGRRQIDRALTMGLEEGRCPVVVLVDEPGESVRAALESASDGESAVENEIESGRRVTDAESAAADAVAELLEPATTLGEYEPDRVCSFFEIGGAEREAVAGDLTDLVLERVALLDVEK
jgi:KEOPS complex subunit Cgi121